MGFQMSKAQATRALGPECLSAQKLRRPSAASQVVRVAAYFETVTSKVRWGQARLSNQKPQAV